MSQRTKRVTSRNIRPKAHAVPARDIVLNYLESIYTAASASTIFAQCDWTGRKTGIVRVRAILRQLVDEGFVEVIPRNEQNSENLFKFVKGFSEAEVVIAPAEPIRELALPIVPPRVIEFFPYVKQPEPAYRPGAFDHLK